MELYTQRHTERPTFRFSVSTQRYPFVVKAFYRFFEKIDPERFEIHLKESSMDMVIRDVQERCSDLGIIFLSTATENFIHKYLEVRGLEFNEIKAISPCVFFHKNHPMAQYDEVNLSDMRDYPFASFESGTAIPVDFSEEALLVDISALEKRFYVIDRGTMINTLTHTNAFSIGTGILPEGYAGPELTSRPIKGHHQDIRLGWIQRKGEMTSNETSEFLYEIKRVLEE